MNSATGSQLKTPDWLAILDIIRALHEVEDPEALRAEACRGVSRLVGGVRVTFEHIAPASGEAWAVAEPNLSYHFSEWRTFLENIGEHPAVVNYMTTGEQAARKISDFVDARDWRRTRLYRELYHFFGYEDQMGVCLAPPGEAFYAVVVSRGERSFSERDRQLLDLLRPYIAQAHGNAMTLARLRREAEGREASERCLSQSAIIMEAGGRRILRCPNRAEAWLREYFGEGPRGGRLPEPLDLWVKQIASPDANAPPARRTLVRERAGCRLLLRLRRADAEGRVAVVMEARSVPNEGMAGRLGLTSRQLAVLLEIEKGKTNQEVATALSISPLTVRKHLENIFERLGVASRAQAARRLRQAALLE